MLSFDVCMALKKAGFPQEWPETYGDSQAKFWAEGNNNHLPLASYWVQQDEVHDGTFCDGEYKIICKEPTIEDLLRELGEDFWQLFKDGDRCWWATSKKHADSCTFDNAEQALAHLYLALLPTV